MAEPRSAVAFVPGQDTEAQEANLRYQQALQKLTESLDQRKNRFFDPVFLAAARGFLEPGAPSFYQAMGRAAGNVQEAQLAAEKEERDIAQQGLAVATQGVELARMRARDREFGRLLGGLSGEPSGAPAGARSGALPAEAQAATTGGLPGPRPQVDEEDDFGIQIAPADPSRLTGRQYLAMSRFDPSVSPSEALAKASEIDRRNVETREGGVFNLATGRFYPAATGKTVEVEVFGYPGTYVLNERDAAVLSNLLARGESEKYKAYARRIIEGPSSGRAAAAPTTAAPTTAAPTTAAATTTAVQTAPAAPTAVAAPAEEPARRSSVQEREERKRQQEVEQAGALQRVKKLEDLAAEREANLPQVESSARSTIASTVRLQKLLDASPNAFGIFSNPTITSAFAKLIQDGIQTPRGSLNFGGFEEAVLRAMPGIKKQDLDNYRRAASELAEVELGYTQTYLRGQGQITEGERKIVRALGGQVSDSAPMIRSRSELIQARSQYEVDAVDLFRQWKEKNPNKSYLDFERTSPELKKLKADLDQKAERIYDKYLAPRQGAQAAGQPAQAAAQPAAQAAQPAPRIQGAGQPSPGFIRDPETGRIRRKRPGE